MKEKLIDKEQIKQKTPFFRSCFGGWVLDFVFWLAGAKKVNAVYDASKRFTGTAFTDDLLNRLKIKRIVEHGDVLRRFVGQPFITVSNHPYGHIDGIISISVVGGVRKDFKVMVNWMLNEIDTMQEHFIGVNPYSEGKMNDMKSSVGGIKQCMEQLRSGHPLGLFPAGGVSNNYFTKTEDAEWKPVVIRLIKKARVPVIPMYFSGNNSWIYRALGVISWKLRTIRLLHEVTNKFGKTIHIRFGEPIMPDVQDKFTDIAEFGKFLKEQTYRLKNRQ